jgi:hypothetical protein
VGLRSRFLGGFKTPLRLDQLLTDRAVFHFCCGSPGLLCLLPGGPFPPLLSNSLRVALSPLLLVKPIAQSSPLRVARFLLLHSKPMALDAAVAIHAPLADVPVDARDAREVFFQPKLDGCFLADFLHRDPSYLIGGDSQREIFNRSQEKTPTNQTLTTSH